MLFTENRQPKKGYYLAIPRTSSENRRYLPIKLLSSGIIAANDIQLIENTNAYHFGILTSLIHMVWMSTLTGRLESRYRYSNKIVYNNFPWPSASDKQIKEVERTAQSVLTERAKFPTATLADLYDRNTMPPELVQAHAELDRAVDQCYRKEPFKTERERVEFLFQLYEKITTPLATTESPKKGRGKRLVAK